MWCWFSVGGVSGVGQCGGGVCHGNGRECSDGSGECGGGGAEVLVVLMAGVNDGVVVVMVA